MRQTALLLGTLTLLVPLVFIQARGRQQEQSGPKSLDIYFIDTEGGQATLFVPSPGETLLMDTSTGDDGNIQADRISAAIKQVGVQPARLRDHVPLPR
jgi:competence protein ComEC